MVDFLKLQTYNLILIDYFNTSKLLTWVSDTDRLNPYDKEVVKTKTVRQYKEIDFCFYQNRLDIFFKPHYYFNDNLHNANDFKIVDCIKVLNDFKNAFQIDLKELKVVNIEFGLNVISPIDVKDLVYCLVYHQKNQFRTDAGFGYSIKSYSINKNGAINWYKVIKAYAKGLQYPKYSDKNTFRFEIKSRERKYCSTQLEINTAQDLLNVAVYLKMIEVLKKEFKEVLILDEVTDFDAVLNPKELTKLKKYLNVSFWHKIKNDKRNSFSKNKTAYYRLIGKVENNLKNQLENIVFAKLEILKEGAISRPERIKKGCNFQTEQKIKKGAISKVYIGGNCTQNEIQGVGVKKSVCKITGFDISMQKENSILLSHTGLRYYFENDKECFERVKSRYLSKAWYNSDFEIQIKELAHNIRNRINNQRLQQKRLYPTEQLNLLEGLQI